MEDKKTAKKLKKKPLTGCFEVETKKPFIRMADFIRSEKAEEKEDAAYDEKTAKCDEWAAHREAINECGQQYLDSLEQQRKI